MAAQVVKIDLLAGLQHSRLYHNTFFRFLLYLLYPTQIHHGRV